MCGGLKGGGGGAFKLIQIIQTAACGVIDWVEDEDLWEIKKEHYAVV